MAGPDLPNTDDSERDRPEYWTKSRLELATWLRTKSPSLADVYEGAVDLAYSNRSVPGWTRFVCHAMREIGNRLPEFVVGRTARARAGARELIPDLVEAWTEEGYPEDGTLPGGLFARDADVPGDATIPVSHRVVRVTSAMVRDYVVGCGSRRDATDLLFQALTPTGEADRAKLRTMADKWHKIKNWTVKGAHVSKDGSNEVDPNDCQEQFRVFQTILGSLVWDFFTTAGEIDEILEDANA